MCWGAHSKGCIYVVQRMGRVFSGQYDFTTAKMSMYYLYLENRFSNVLECSDYTCVRVCHLLRCSVKSSKLEFCKYSYCDTSLKVSFHKGAPFLVLHRYLITMRLQ